MSIELNVSAHFHNVLKERLQNNDKQDEIELYYELLSSGHSVGEILNAVGSIQRKPEHINLATAEHPQSESGRVATDAMLGAALVDEAQVHAPYAPGLSALPEIGSCRTEKPQASEGPLLNEFRSDDWIQLLSASLHARRGKFSSTAKRIAFFVVFMVVISSASITGFLVMRGGRNAEPAPTHVQSDISIETEAVAIRNPAEVHSGIVAKPLIQKQQIGSAAPSYAPNPSLPTEPDTALSSPAQKVEVEVQNAAFADRPEAEDSQGSEPGQPDGIAQLIEKLITRASNR
jgi:hypothetical protein